MWNREHIVATNLRDRRISDRPRGYRKVGDVPSRRAITGSTVRAAKAPSAFSAATPKPKRLVELFLRIFRLVFGFLARWRSGQFSGLPAHDEFPKAIFWRA